MPLTTTASIVADAVASRRGAAALNVLTLEHAEAIVAGASAAGCPVILQISHNAVRFHGDDERPLAAACREVAAAADVDVSLHLDHVETVELALRAPDSGFSSVMFDGSRLPYEDNVAQTREVAEKLHARGVWVEAELGEIGGKDGAHAPGVRTDPSEAADFVHSTGVHGLAVAVGSSHAMVERTARIDLALVGRLRDAVAVPLVLHGSSGVPDEDLRAAVRHGMTKINIGTAVNIAWTSAIRQALAADAAGVDPRRYLRAARVAASDTVTHLIEVVST